MGEHDEVGEFEPQAEATSAENAPVLEPPEPTLVEPVETTPELVEPVPLIEPVETPPDPADDPAPSLLSPLGRAVLTWSIIAVLLVVAFFSAIAAINREFYSAQGFVTGYLSALARGDMADALRFDGVTLPDEGSRALLSSAALAELSDIEVVGELPFGDGGRLVTVSYVIGAPDSAPHRLESTFHVHPQPSSFWLFESWYFADSPIGTLDVRVLNDPGFRANGMQVDTPDTALAGDTTAYLVATPGLYRLDHDSVYMTATPTDAIISQVGEHAQASVEVTAKPAFVERVQQELNEYLDACAEQTVLFPRDCPFGQVITNRIATEPEWSIAGYPVVALNGTGTGWLVPRVPGTAHLRVDVKSIFDGSVSPFDEDVAFSVSYAITLSPDGRLNITEVL